MEEQISALSFIALFVTNVSHFLHLALLRLAQNPLKLRGVFPPPSPYFASDLYTVQLIESVTSSLR